MSKSLKELIENAEETIKGAYEKGYSDGRAARDSEIVRCKDCKHSAWDKFCKCYWCKGKERTADFFCADGERREDE